MEEWRLGFRKGTWDIWHGTMCHMAIVLAPIPVSCVCLMLDPRDRMQCVRAQMLIKPRDEELHVGSKRSHVQSREWVPSLVTCRPFISTGVRN